MRGKLYSMHKRKTQKRQIWYVQFKQPDGTYGTAKSTGCTNKPDSEAWVQNYLSCGQIIQKEHVRFSSFAADFFDHDGEYAKIKRIKKHQGKVPGLRQLDNQNGYLNKHLLPYFNNYLFTYIDDRAIEIFQLYLYDEKKLSASTINHICTALKIILTEAYRNRIIQVVPSINQVRGNPEIRGILTVEEVQNLFNLVWADQIAYTACLVAAVTGLRMGEIQALQRQDIPETGDFPVLLIKHSWDTAYLQIKETKTGHNRTVPIHPFALKSIYNLLNLSPYKDPSSFVFYGDREDRPILPKDISSGFYAALTKIGIPDNIRRDRRIVFHSWRHWANSYTLNKGIPVHKVMSITGHRSERMVENYYHGDDYRDVIQAYDAVFG